jgi:hypothetical protein
VWRCRNGDAPVAWPSVSPIYSFDGMLQKKGHHLPRSSLSCFKKGSSAISSVHVMLPLKKVISCLVDPRHAPPKNTAAASPVRPTAAHPPAHAGKRSERISWGKKVLIHFPRFCFRMFYPSNVKLAGSPPPPLIGKCSVCLLKLF